MAPEERGALNPPSNKAAGSDGQPLADIAALLYRSRYGGERPEFLRAEADIALRRLRRLPRRG